MVEEILGTAVEAGTGDDVSTGLYDGLEAVGDGGCAGGEADCGDPTFEYCETVLEGVNGGVGKAGVYRPGVREVEAVGGVFGAVEDEGGGEVDREVAGAHVVVDTLSGMHGLGGEVPVGGVAVVVLGGHFSSPLTVV